jgi:hypothetical protein
MDKEKLKKNILALLAKIVIKYISYNFFVAAYMISFVLLIIADLELFGGIIFPERIINQFSNFSYSSSTALPIKDFIKGFVALPSLLILVGSYLAHFIAQKAFNKEISITLKQKSIFSIAFITVAYMAFFITILSWPSSEEVSKLLIAGIIGAMYFFSLISLGIYVLLQFFQSIISVNFD